MKRYINSRVLSIEHLPAEERVVVTSVRVSGYPRPDRAVMSLKGGAAAITRATFADIGITDLDEAHMLLHGQGVVLSSKDGGPFNVEVFYPIECGEGLDESKCLPVHGEPGAESFAGKVVAADYQRREAGPVTRLYVQTTKSCSLEPVDIYLYGRGAETGLLWLHNLGVTDLGTGGEARWTLQERMERTQGAYIAVCRNNGFARVVRCGR